MGISHQTFFSSEISGVCPLYLQFYRLCPLSVVVNVIALRICSFVLLSFEVHVSSVGGEGRSPTPLFNNVASMQTSNKMPRVSNPRRPRVRNRQNHTEVDKNKEPGSHLPQ